MNILDLAKISPYSLNKIKKDRIFLELFKNLNEYHLKNCKDYKKIFNMIREKKIKSISDFPMLPVRIFKDHDLVSIKKENIKKKLFSSGTTSSKRSKIYLDDENSKIQIKILSNLITSMFGDQRLPMLILGDERKVKTKKDFDAKKAAISGFSFYGKNHTYIIENGEICYSKLNDFLNSFGEKKFLLFGFTSDIFEFLIKKINKDKVISKFDNCILIHGGGWKKLEKFKISNELFKKKLYSILGIKKIHNYYGLVEQTGSIFFECEYGNLHASIYSDIFIRDKNFNLIENNKIGFIQIISLLPKSYPGHNLITEDLGRIKGEDDCKCGRKGKYFEVFGRVKFAEIRGCSNV